MTYLNQTEYTEQIGKTSMTDYRGVYQADFEPLHIYQNGETFEYILAAIKPSRISL